VKTSTPCEADPDKWFIDRDGRKYDDEVLVSEGQLRAGITDLQEEVVTFAEVDAVLDDLTAEAVRARMVERRHARDACHVECKVRTLCLQKALDNQEQYGIWGGYYPEQRRQLEREMEARRLRRLGRVG
jgi:hypothetical protein